MYLFGLWCGLNKKIPMRPTVQCWAGQKEGCHGRCLGLRACRPQALESDTHVGLCVCVADTVDGLPRDISFSVPLSSLIVIRYLLSSVHVILSGRLDPFLRLWVGLIV